MSIRLPSMLFAALLPILLLAGGIQARAETAMIDVLHLPLDEAAAAAMSQLSADGRIAQMPSRRLLIVTDDADHIEQVRDLLRQLDSAPAQLSMQVAISGQRASDHNSVAASTALPGGWIRLTAAANSAHSNNKRDFMLRTSSGSSGRIEAGEIRVVGQSVRQYLTAHGIMSESSVETMNVTGGFDVQAALLPNDQVRLSIHPWLKNMATDSSMDAKAEMLIDAGSTLNTGQPPSTNAPLRMNVQPQTAPAQAANAGRIMVAEASTEITVPLGETVTLAASRNAAGEFSSVLLGVNAFNQRDDLLMTVTITRAGM